MRKKRNGKTKPIRFIKQGANKSASYAFYEAQTNCGKLKVQVLAQRDSDDENSAEYPIRIKAEPVGGGCHALIEALSRICTMWFESDGSWDELYKQLSVVRCPACMRAMGKSIGKGEKPNLAKSCASAIAESIKKYFEEG